MSLDLGKISHFDLQFQEKKYKICFLVAWKKKKKERKTQILSVDHTEKYETHLYRDVIFPSNVGFNFFFFFSFEKKLMILNRGFRKFHFIILEIELLQ